MDRLSAIVGTKLELNALTVAPVLLAVVVLERVWTYFKNVKAVNNLPGIRCIFEPFTVLGAGIPSNSWNLGLNFQWNRRLDLYQKVGLDTISIVPYALGKSRIWTANLDVARQVVAGGPGSPWIKPEEFSRALLLWGMNLAAATGADLWRRHRRIMGPAFNNRTYALVWEETMRVYKDMIKYEGWTDKDVVDVPVVQVHTFKLALFVISHCGFGLPFSWSEPPTDKGGSMSLQEALRIVSETNFERIFFPKWILNLPVEKFKNSNRAYDTLDAFMRSQVAQRKTEIRQELAENAEIGAGGDIVRSDVFSRLVLANESDTEKLPLDDQELIGNVFVLLFAGHETTGHTLAAALGFLGIYEEEQDAVYENIIDVVGHDRDPTFEDYPALYKVLAAFYESLRLIPAGSLMIRETTKDTILTVPNAQDTEGAAQQLLIKKDQLVIVDVVGIQYNPRYFPDPYAYKPSRWYAQEKSEAADAFTAFSIGPRACIGRKFATTEAVCWLTLLLRDWRVEIVLKDGETREHWRERVMQAQMVMTLSVGPVPVRLVRRK